MLNYDFQILQPNEFEHLTRDLLQKRDAVFVESFTPGKDNGIDLRFAWTKEDKVIVQAKRYKDYSSLKRNLISEVEKVRLLEPTRYILSTSVGLTPNNKEELKNLFSPYILSTTDILGKDDLNNLLGLYSDVEKKYYKLWLGSTGVLESILDKRIDNWSALELEKMRRDVSIYVMNDSFDKALDILMKNRYVIISGIPGIGKTTLSRMLVNYLLGKGYEEFVMLETIGDAAQKLAVGKKQVFFYDDFLGSTFFQNDEKGFDRKLVSFIDKVKHENDKIFILSTREYIFAEAKQYYDVFQTSNVELAKCVLDLSDYTESIRAEILYNHLSAAELPQPYIRALLYERRYLRIIKHPNFNPRIIETFLNSQIYKSVIPDQFVSKFIDFFNKPLSVWDIAFNQLAPIAKYALFVRMSMGERPVILDEWYKATKMFISGAKELSLILDEQVWKGILKILEGTFVYTTIRHSHFLVFFQNPSVYDFLSEKLSELQDVKMLIIREAYFAEQLYNTFSDIGFPEFFNYGRIKIDSSLFPVLKESYVRMLSDLHSCSLNEYITCVLKENLNLVDYLCRMEKSFSIFFKQNPSLFFEAVNQDVLENSKFSLMKRMSLFEKLGDNAAEYLDLERLADKVKDELEEVDDFVNSITLLKNTETGKAALCSKEFCVRIEEALEAELEVVESEEDCVRIQDCLSVLTSNVLYLDKDVWEASVDEVKNGLYREPEPDEDLSREYRADYEPKDKYDEMFSSLLS